MNSTESCAGKKNVMKNGITPGEPVSFFLETNSLSLEPGQEYCYITGLDPGDITSKDYNHHHKERLLMYYA